MALPEEQPRPHDDAPSLPFVEHALIQDRLRLLRADTVILLSNNRALKDGVPSWAAYNSPYLLDPSNSHRQEVAVWMSACNEPVEGGSCVLPHVHIIEMEIHYRPETDQGPEYYDLMSRHFWVDNNNTIYYGVGFSTNIKTPRPFLPHLVDSIGYLDPTAEDPSAAVFQVKDNNLAIAFPFDKETRRPSPRFIVNASMSEIYPFGGPESTHIADKHYAIDQATGILGRLVNLSPVAISTNAM